ncbi:hypothetical protein [Deinococcus hopiensis]|nr:hypothetical protein [Deinococcus hopiensis]
MPRRAVPSDSDRAAFISLWLRRLGRDEARREALEAGNLASAYPTAADPQAALSEEHTAFAALAWLDAHATRLGEGEVAALLPDTRIRAGNSVQKLLWKSRVAFVAALGAHLKLPSRVPKWVVMASVAAGHLPPTALPPVKSAPDAPPPPPPYLVTLANKPSVLIDRATRGATGWDGTTLQYREAFEDGLVLNYFEKETTPEVLRQHLQRLDPRTSDVWRLLTAKVLESERDDVFAPVTVQPAELARALGLKPHPNGSVRPRDIVRCTESLFHLERLWLTMPDARGKDEKGTRKRVLAVMERGRSKIIDGQEVPSSWTIVLGDWARYFPRTYAPIFRGLVELPANSSTNVWTKQIGTELTYLIRETSDAPGNVRLVHVATLLTRASVMPEVLEMREHRNHHRAIERLEAALDLLTTLGVHAGWRYEPGSAAALDAASTHKFFGVWLECFVEITVAEELLRSVAALQADTVA